MADTPIGPGTLLAGRFTLEDLLDETAGARFWRATDNILARNVAVHVVAADDPRSEALLSAARTSATVTDAHLLRVLDAATEDGVTYVVNEWGPGVSLDKLLAEGPLSARRAAWVVKEVAEAVTTAHRHGIAHGRLLPENVVITEAGSVKLIGFVVDAVLRGREQSRVTGGPPVGEHEADVVNLAALLYAGLVGRWPGTVGSVVPDAPVEHGRALRPRQVRAGIPRPLDAICERVLHPETHGGPLMTAHEVYAALCDFIGDPTGASPVGIEATTFLDEAELAELRGTNGTEAAPTQQAAQPATRSGRDESGDEGADRGLEATGALEPATAATPPQTDPEATQAGAPVFDEEPVGWSHDPEATQAAPPPPPPPFTDPEPRPLFASDQPREPRPDPRSRPADPTHGPSTGGTGSLPPVWGPDADAPPDDEQVDDWDDEGRSWIRLAVAIGGVVVLVVAIIVAFNLGQGVGDPEVSAEPTEPTRSAEPPRPVAIAAVSDFDPLGDPPEENGDSAPLAADGNAGTAWPTSTYYDPLELQKEGVGLLVDLGKPTEVSEVSVSFLGSPTSVEVLAAPDGGAAPTSTEGLTRVAAEEEAGARADLRLDQKVTTQYLVVWLTSLPPADGGYRAEVSEIVVRR